MRLDAVEEGTIRKRKISKTGSRVKRQASNPCKTAACSYNVRSTLDCEANTLLVGNFPRLYKEVQFRAS